MAMLFQLWNSLSLEVARDTADPTLLTRLKIIDLEIRSITWLMMTNTKFLESQKQGKVGKISVILNLSPCHRIQTSIFKTSKFQQIIICRSLQKTFSDLKMPPWNFHLINANIRKEISHSWHRNVEISSIQMGLDTSHHQRKSPDKKI